MLNDLLDAQDEDELSAELDDGVIGGPGIGYRIIKTSGCTQNDEGDSDPEKSPIVTPADAKSSGSSSTMPRKGAAVGLIASSRRLRPSRVQMQESFSLAHLNDQDDSEDSKHYDNKSEFDHELDLERNYRKHVDVGDDDIEIGMEDDHEGDLNETERNSRKFTRTRMKDEKPTNVIGTSSTLFVGGNKLSRGGRMSRTGEDSDDSSVERSPKRSPSRRRRLGAPTIDLDHDHEHDHENDETRNEFSNSSTNKLSRSQRINTGDRKMSRDDVEDEGNKISKIEKEGHNDNNSEINLENDDDDDDSESCSCENHSSLDDDDADESLDTNISKSRPNSRPNFDLGKNDASAEKSQNKNNKKSDKDLSNGTNRTHHGKTKLKPGTFLPSEVIDKSKEFKDRNNNSSSRHNNNSRFNDGTKNNLLSHHHNRRSSSSPNSNSRGHHSHRHREQTNHRTDYHSNREHMRTRDHVSTRLAVKRTHYHAVESDPTIARATRASRNYTMQSRSGRLPRTQNASDANLPKDYETILSELFTDACFFQMKSGNHENIEISKSMGVWSTPSRNDSKINQAFHEFKNVILIFSVKQSGKFAGFARVTSESSQSLPIRWHLPNGFDETQFGGVFKLDWISGVELPFHRTTHLMNPLNENKPVKVARDGQELDPVIGEQLCRLFEQDDSIDLVPIIRLMRRQASSFPHHHHRSLPHNPHHHQHHAPHLNLPLNGSSSRVGRETTSLHVHQRLSALPVGDSRGEYGYYHHQGGHSSLIQGHAAHQYHNYHHAQHYGGNLRYGLPPSHSGAPANVYNPRYDMSTMHAHTYDSNYHYHGSSATSYLPRTGYNQIDNSTGYHYQHHHSIAPTHYSTRNLPQRDHHLALHQRDQPITKRARTSNINNNAIKNVNKVTRNRPRRKIDEEMEEGEEEDDDDDEDEDDIDDANIKAKLAVV